MGSSAKIITEDEFYQFATENEFPKPSKAKYDAFIKANSSPKYNIRDRQEAAMFFAHVIQESGGYVDLKEKNPPVGAYGYTKTEPPKDRQQFCGRGYIQLSHDYNYLPASKALFEHIPKIEGIEAEDTLAKNPSLVEKNELIAWHTALWYWTTQVKKSEVQCTISHYRFGETTKVINSMECENPVGELNKKARKRFKYYKKNLEILRIAAQPIEAGCY